MRARYEAYFLNKVLELQDGLASYYVQDSFYMDDVLPGIELKSFFDHREAVNWIKECVHYENSGTRHLRSFLSDSAPRSYLLYQMDDDEVMDEVARVIMTYNYPVVVRPLFELPEHQSELIDMIFEARNSGAPPIEKSTEPQPYFQIKRAGMYSYDNNIALNVLKVLANSATEISWNAGVDAANVVLHDAQYIGDKGLGPYLKARLNTEINWAKNTARAINDAIKDGPRQVMDAITTADLQTVKDFFGSALYAKNWETALQIGLAIYLTKRAKTTIPEGTGVSTPRKTKTTKPNRSQPFIDGPKDRTIGLDPDEINLKKKVKSKTDKGPKKTTKPKLTKAQIDETVNKTGKSIKNHPLRKEYEDAVSGLKDMELDLKRQGLSEESIAKKLHQARRDLGVKYKNLTPKELKEYIYEVNESRYGDKLGPTFDYLKNVKKKSYAEIIQSAQRPNTDIDKLLGGFKKWLLTKNGY